MSSQVAPVDRPRPSSLWLGLKEKTVNLYQWALLAKTGERKVYHRGALGTMPERFMEDGERASREGLLFLAHRPLGDGQYAYEATRISSQCAKLLGLTGRPGGGILAEVRLPRLTHPMVMA